MIWILWIDKKWLLAVIAVICLVFTYVFLGNLENRDDGVLESKNNYTYNIKSTYPHDSSTFTQGLVYAHGKLYEGTGLYGMSSVRIVELETGKILQMVNMSSDFFGEGITIHDNRIIQLTWKSKKAFIYDLTNLDSIGSFNISSEGWGLTTNGTHLIYSDGTSTIRFLEPTDFKEVYTVQVKYNGKPITKINELEYIQGELYANIWQTNNIVRINPDTGAVNDWISLEGIEELFDKGVEIDVLNGIAYDEANNRIFVTGKLWPKLFEIETVPDN